jgi:Arc/MetJ-type ribon-helix-helix transcriptional regulator
MKRTNFYVDDERLEALKHVATAERISVSDLVREGIDRVIRERMRGKPDRAALRADLEEYLRRNVGKGPHRAQEEIEDLVTAVMDER